MSSSQSPVRDPIAERASDDSLGKLTLSAFVGAVLLAETAVFTGRVTFGLAIHLLVLWFSLLVPLRYRSTLPLLMPLSLVPLVRIVGVTMPPISDIRLVTLAVSYLVLLPPVLLVYHAHDRLSVATQAETLLKWSLPIITASVVIGAATQQFLAPEPIVPELTFRWVIVGSVLLIGLVGFLEELIFRGGVQRILADRYGRVVGITVGATLFGAMHSVYASEPRLVYAVTFGAVLGVVYERTRDLGLVVLFNGVTNVLLFVILPLQHVL